MQDAAEAEKKALGATAEQGEADKHAHVENFALELFEKADDADRKGQSNLATAKVFNSAYHVMEACKQFGGELPEDMLEKIKYAKWRVVEIAKATKERRAPAPPRGLEQPEAAEEGSDGQGMPSGDGGSDGAAQPPPPPDAAPPVGGPASPAATRLQGSLRRQESCHRHRLSMRVIRRPSTRRCYRGHRPACRLRIRADHHQACPHPYPWVCQLVPGTRVAPQPTAPLQCRRYPLLTRRASRRCSRHTSSARAHRPVRRAHTSACARTYTCPRACALMPYTRARASAKPCTLVVLRGPGCLD